MWVPLISANVGTDDKLIWGNTRDGNLTAKGVYNFLMRREDQVYARKNWTWLWKIPCTQRMRVFMWLCMHGRLMVNSERARRGFSNTAQCPQCNNPVESEIHVIRDCATAHSFWTAHVPSQTHHKFFTMSKEEWLSLNCNSGGLQSKVWADVPWAMIFVYAIWVIWTSRNRFVFDGVILPLP